MVMSVSDSDIAQKMHARTHQRFDRHAARRAERASFVKRNCRPGRTAFCATELLNTHQTQISITRAELTLRRAVSSVRLTNVVKKDVKCEIALEVQKIHGTKKSVLNKLARSEHERARPIHQLKCQTMAAKTFPMTLHSPHRIHLHLENGKSEIEGVTGAHFRPSCSTNAPFGMVPIGAERRSGGKHLTWVPATSKTAIACWHGGILE